MNADKRVEKCRKLCQRGNANHQFVSFHYWFAQRKRKNVYVLMYKEATEHPYTLRTFASCR